jgi:hypothetical protein
MSKGRLQFKARATAFIAGDVIFLLTAIAPTDERTAQIWRVISDTFNLVRAATPAPSFKAQVSVKKARSVIKGAPGV